MSAMSRSSGIWDEYPETRFTPNGTMNVSFSIATNRKFRDSSGQDQERTNWFNVTAWGRLAETLDNMGQQGYLRKGRQVYVYGRLEAREYTDKDGKNRTSLDVNASEVQLLGTRADAESSGEYSSTRPADSRREPAGDPVDLDDVPF